MIGEAGRERLQARMTLEEKVGQMLIPSFRIWRGEPENAPSGNPGVQNACGAEDRGEAVTALNPEIRACLEAHRFGGTLLFAENCRDAEQTLRLVAEMQAANRAGGGLPMLVSIDQEGGSVSRLGFGTPGVGNMALAATGDPENARTMAAIHGKELRLLGIRADYAPVLDVNSNPRNPIIGVRSFSDDPEETARYGTAYVHGLQEQGVAATLKHFPGHGDTDTDSHTGFPCIRKTLEELRAVELVPFRAGVEAGADMVMTAHIQYPLIETETAVSTSTGERVCLPATMSRTLLTDVLRGELGFQGVVVTDALDMAAITDHFGWEDVCCGTINAGADMLILPIIYTAAHFRQTDGAVGDIVRLVRAGRIREDSVDAAVRRILRLKDKLGLLEQTDFSVTEEQVREALEGTGSAFSRRKAWELAGRALTLLKNEGGAFPLALRPGAETLILFAESAAAYTGNAEMAWQTLAMRGRLPEGARVRVMTAGADSRAACVRAAMMAEQVILVSRASGSPGQDSAAREEAAAAVFDAVIRERHREGRTVILVSCQLPYDAARYPEADAILLAYDAGPMRAMPPAAGAGSGWIPNLPAALCACFGMGTPGGRLPVDIPAPDADRRLFSRG